MRVKIVILQYYIFCDLHCIIGINSVTIDTEMQLLKEELGHHQLKLDEYNSLKQEYEALEGWWLILFVNKL